MDDRIYIITYDIADPARWRRVFRVMKGYGEWLQLSVFQCRLSRRRHAELLALLDGIIHHTEDHVVSIDVGRTETVSPRITSLGKIAYAPVKREVVIV